jgi:hypothetical protein
VDKLELPLDDCEGQVVSFKSRHTWQSFAWPPSSWRSLHPPSAATSQPGTVLPSPEPWLSGPNTAYCFYSTVQFPSHSSFHPWIRAGDIIIELTTEHCDQAALRGNPVQSVTSCGHVHEHKRKIEDRKLRTWDWRRASIVFIELSSHIVFSARKKTDFFSISLS